MAGASRLTTSDTVSHASEIAARNLAKDVWGYPQRYCRADGNQHPHKHPNKQY